MKAAVVGPDPAASPLDIRDVPEPQPTGDLVVVRLMRAALNRLDAMMLENRTDEAPGTIFGSDGAGIVAALGPDAKTDPLTATMAAWSHTRCCSSVARRQQPRSSASGSRCGAPSATPPPGLRHRSGRAARSPMTTQQRAAQQARNLGQSRGWPVADGPACHPVGGRAAAGPNHGRRPVRDRGHVPVRARHPQPAPRLAPARRPDRGRGRALPGQ